ncbi:hypothetical protein LTR78_007611 [Recurvomyces mirabilis]|uniref:Uncharacterized protein n=2 Tax=Recurvomyces mirabilis TaxID=574656 RepID=A0AAE0WJ77_9PEZI|nr:hypothetical protein LTR78_007611 [Recurvomyces mirabilis]
MIVSQSATSGIFTIGSREAASSMTMIRKRAGNMQTTLWTALDMFDKHRQTIQYYEHAVQHNSNAIRHARPIMTRSDAEHSEALFNFSALTSLFAFAEPPLRRVQRQQQAHHDLLDDLLDAFRMGKGNRAVMSCHAENLTEVKQTNDKRWSVDKDSTKSSLEMEYPQLARLRDMVRTSCDNQRQTAACCIALQELFGNISALSKHSGNHSSAYIIMTWASNLDPLFMDMCEARHPVALVILGHYAVMIHLRRAMWFFALWPRLLLTYTRERLPSAFDHYLDWPAETLEYCSTTGAE